MTTDRFYQVWLPRCASRKVIVAPQQPTNGWLLDFLTNIPNLLFLIDCFKKCVLNNGRIHLENTKWKNIKSI